MVEVRRQWRHNRDDEQIACGEPLTTAVPMWNSSMRVGNNTFVIASVKMPMKAMSPVATMASSSLGSTRSEAGCVTGVWALEDDVEESERTRLGIG